MNAKTKCNIGNEIQRRKRYAASLLRLGLQKQEHFEQMLLNLGLQLSTRVSCTVIGYVRRQAEEAEVSPFSRPTYGSERGIVVTACSHFEAPVATYWRRYKDQA